MYEKDTDEKQASQWGLRLEEIPVETIDVWEDNWDSFLLFNSLSTQWRVGTGGATGLDYSVIESVGKLMGYKRKKIASMFPDLRVMENEALITMGENREDDNNS